MSKLFTLIKANITDSLKINKFFKKRNSESKAPIVLIGLAGIGVFALFFLYMFLYGKILSDNGAPKGILLLAICLASLLIAMTSLTSANSYLFEPKDFDLLMSLPIDTKTIFLSKVIDFLLINYLTLLYFYLPAQIAYAIFNPTGVYYWVLSILSFFILPLIPMTVFGLISYLFSFIHIGIRVRKAIKTMFYLAFSLGIIMCSFAIDSEESEAVFFLGMLDKFKNIYYPGYIGYLGITNDIYHYLIFLGISVIPFSLFVLLVSRGYLKANKVASSNYKKTNKKEVVYKKKSKVKALFSKEIKGYFQNPAYVGNTLIGPIISIAAVIALLTKASADFVDLGNGEIIEMGLFIPFMMILVICWVVSLTPTTSASISLEGKSMWILKNLPIDFNDVKRSKLFVNYLVTIPFVLIDFIIIVIFRKLELIEMISLILVPTIMAVVCAKLGLLFNLSKHRFDYDNPAKAVKQGISVLFSLLASTGILIIMFALILSIFIIASNKLLSYLVAIGFSIIIYIIATLLLNKRGRKLYNRIEC